MDEERLEATVAAAGGAVAGAIGLVVVLSVAASLGAWSAGVALLALAFVAMFVLIARASPKSAVAIAGGLLAGAALLVASTGLVTFKPGVAGASLNAALFASLTGDAAISTWLACRFAPPKVTRPLFAAATASIFSAPIALLALWASTLST